MSCTAEDYLYTRGSSSRVAFSMATRTSLSASSGFGRSLSSRPRGSASAPSHSCQILLPFAHLSINTPGLQRKRNAQPFRPEESRRPGDHRTDQWRRNLAVSEDCLHLWPSSTSWSAIRIGDTWAPSVPSTDGCLTSPFPSYPRLYRDI